MRHLFLKKWWTYVFYIDRVGISVFPRKQWIATEMRSEHRSTPAHLPETVSYRLWGTIVRVLCVMSGLLLFGVSQNKARPGVGSETKLI